MKIRITGHSGEGIFPFGTAGPWKEFEREVICRGHYICGDSYSEEADAIIANSFNSQIHDYIVKSKIPKNRRILVLWEPYIVERTRYLFKVRELFGSIFAPSIDWANRVGGKAFPWPQDDFTDSKVFDNWEARRNQAVMIQGNKFSAIKGEQYSLRRRVLSLIGEDELTLVGTNWNTGLRFDWWHWSRSFLNSSIRDISLASVFGMGKKYPQYRGASSDKSQTLKEFQISIVIENSTDFISEKLFDSVRAGCVTIYSGPNLQRYGISSNSALQVSQNPMEIVRLVRELLNLDNKERQSLAKKQYSALEPSLRESNNHKVLSNIAKDMLTILER